MLADGIYRIQYHARAGGEDDGDSALAVLRDGRIMGSDKHGGMFLGTYRSDPASGHANVNLRFDVPANGMLITGQSGGKRGRSLDIAIAFEPRQGTTKAVVDLAGQPVAVELSFVGPLPP